VEVPVMLSLVAIANRNGRLFPHDTGCQASETQATAAGAP
jgi:hypothetical protein